MSFDEFLNRRLAELLRFALVLCGDPARADDLVADVLVRSYPHWSALVAADRPFAAVRTAVVRRFLAGDGHGDLAAGGSVGTRSITAPADLAIDVVAFATALSTLPDHVRAALSLAVYSGQTEPEIAAAVRRPLEVVGSDLVEASAALDTATDSGDRARLIDLFDELGDSVEVDVDPLASSVLDRLESSLYDEADPAVFEAMFATSVPAPMAHVTDAEVRTANGRDAATMVTAVGTGSLAAPPIAADSRQPSVAPRGAAPHSRTPALMSIVLVTLAAGVSVLLSASRNQEPARAAAPHRPHAVASISDPGAGASATSPIGHSLPGTKIVSQYFGAGARTVRGPRHNTGDGRELAINAVCSGTGSATIGPVTIPNCDGVSVGANVTAAQIRSLKIRANPISTWRFAIVDEPEHRTSGTLRYPVDPELTGGSLITRVARASGTGSRSVMLASGTTTSRVEDLRLILTCKGAGVSFASDDHRFDGEYTHTCFQGWSYEFDVSAAVVPSTLSVTASRDTSWRLVVIRS